MYKQQYKPKTNVKLKNKLTNDIMLVDIINEDSIEGKAFWIVKTNQRTLKLAKDAYVIQNAK
jgi:hypothetical protein